MRKFIMLLCLTIFITSSASSLVAGAQENATASDTNSTTSKLVETSNINGSPTETKVKTATESFRVGPTVSLRPLDSEINTSQDGIVELFLNNPSLNDCTLETDMEISVPSNIYIYAEDGGMTGGAGTVTGHFTVPPGSSRTITLHIKGEKVGKYPVHFNGMYWPGNNKDMWNPINLDNSFQVTEPSNSGHGPEPLPMPGFGALGLIMILMMVTILRRK
jgi:hypothetical protein